jgi:acetoacetyl-CoA synthetase
VFDEPLPSMPVRFWGDADGSRYRDSYFDHFRGSGATAISFASTRVAGVFVLGRSDATLNRHGVRIGTAESTARWPAFPRSKTRLIVNLDLPGGKFFMPLFVKLKGDRGSTANSKAVSARTSGASIPRVTYRTGSSRWSPFRTR